MFKKAVGTFIINLILVCSLRAELNWWHAQQMPILSGYTDSYMVAMNRHGKAIAMFDNKVFGSYDVNSNQWDLMQLDCMSSEVPILTRYSGTSSYEFTIGKPSKGRTILLSDNNEGWALFTVPQGAHKGKIGVIRYTLLGWSGVEVLSDEVGGEATIAQGYDGRALVVWINKAKGSEQEGKLMAAYYEGTHWIKQGVISTQKSIEMDYNQIGPQLVMSDLGDALVVWKVESIQSSDQEGLLVAHYFDGVEEEWCAEEVIGEQPVEKKGRDLVTDAHGEIFLVWDSQRGIEAASMNLMKYMIYRSGWGSYNASSKEKIEEGSENTWAKTLLIQGEELNHPKVCVDRQGNAVAIWLSGYSGAYSAYFNKQSKSWEHISEPLTTHAAYANSLNLDGNNKAQAIWIGEGAALTEIICSRTFDFSSKTWGSLNVLNKENENSLVDAVEACSLATSDYGMIMWYDFFKEKLFYSILKEGIDIRMTSQSTDRNSKNHRREGILYQKKVELSKRRAERRTQK